MKKIISIVLLSLILSLVSVTGFAEEMPFVYNPDYVISSEEQETLEDLASEFASDFGYGIYFIFVDELSDYTNESDMSSAAEGFYNDLGLGIGDDMSGVEILVSEAEENYTVYGNEDGGELVMLMSDESFSEFRDKMDEGSWYEACKTLIFTAQNTENENAGIYESLFKKHSFISDEADILTDSEEEQLQNMAESVADQYNFGLYIHTVDDFMDYPHAYTVEDAAEEVYFNCNLGLGTNSDGMLLILSMDDRDFDMFAYGYGNTAFTDYGKDYLDEFFLDDFRNDDWFAGFCDYIEEAGNMLNVSFTDEPVDIGNAPVSVPAGARVTAVIICIVLGIIIGIAVAFILKGQLQSVYMANEADAFVAGGLSLRTRKDIYTHTTTTRVYSPPPKPSGSGGGGGTTISSSGGSHHSGKF